MACELINPRKDLPEVAAQLYGALQSSPCACTEARTWYKDADGKIVPARTCRRCIALERYEAIAEASS